MELFFLGKHMQARYIDYAYVAMMPDVQKQFALCEQQSLESLEESEVIEMDFSGNVTVCDDAVDVLEPVFFGDTESSVSGTRVKRIHLFEGRVTISEADDGRITLSEATDADLLGLLDEDVHIRCSKVGRGFSERTYTKDQLAHEDRKQEALGFMKGDI